MLVCGPSLDKRRVLFTASLVLSLVLVSSILCSHEALKPHVSVAYTTIKETTADVFAAWQEPESAVSLELDLMTNEIWEPLPRIDFSIYKHLPPAHLEQFNRDRRVFATLYCSRRQTPQDPYLAAVQQMIWRILWSDWSSKHPIVIFVCPFITQETRDLFRAQGAFVEELPLVEVHIKQPINFSRWTDQFAKLNLWSFTQYDMIAYLDTDAFPIANLDTVFDAAETQDCKSDLVDEADAPVLASAKNEFCSYLFAGVLDANVLKTNEAQDINGGLLVLRPNLHLHKRLLRNAQRIDEYSTDYMEQSFLSSSLAFGPNSPFPAQQLSPIYNFGGGNLHRLAAAAGSEFTEEPENPQRIVTQNPEDFVPDTPISADRVLVLHDKIWLLTQVVHKNPLVPYWNQMWAVDWMRMCRTYDWELFPTARTLGRKPEIGDGIVTAEQVRQGKVARPAAHVRNDR